MKTTEEITIDVKQHIANALHCIFDNACERHIKTTGEFLEEPPLELEERRILNILKSTLKRIDND